MMFHPEWIHLDSLKNGCPLPHVGSESLFLSRSERQDACLFLFYYILYRSANMGLAGALCLGGLAPRATVCVAPLSRPEASVEGGISDKWFVEGRSTCFFSMLDASFVFEPSKMVKTMDSCEEWDRIRQEGVEVDPEVAGYRTVGRPSCRLQNQTAVFRAATDYEWLWGVLMEFNGWISHISFAPMELASWRVSFSRLRSFASCQRVRLCEPFLSSHEKEVESPLPGPGAAKANDYHHLRMCLLAHCAHALRALPELAEPVWGLHPVEANIKNGKDLPLGHCEIDWNSIR